MKVEVKISGIDGVLATLKALPPEIVSKRGGPVKKALSKGARLLLKKVKANLRQSIAIRGERSTGGLEKRVIASRGKAIIGGNGERYLIRVKKKDYLNADGEITSPLMVANLLEYGSKNQPATPWLRPAVQSEGSVVIDTIKVQLVADIDKTVTSLAKLSKTK